ncbi:MAG: hypothetical protein Ct9H90mP2_13850 [Dehalococcoidia bacterium]|nr:MAG: hypothetical protein Ct9H90mP2_13850 [Dehalococcoidia bacterium]
MIVNNKHVMMDKPAGYDFEKFKNLADIAKQKGLIIELGYMFRQHEGFKLIADWAHSGKNLEKYLWLELICQQIYLR